MDHELFEQASHPIVRNLTGTVLLSRLTEAARAQALEALSAALARPEALALADALAAPLAEAREAAADPEAAVAAAKKALAKAQHSFAGLAESYWQKRRQGELSDDTQPPKQDTPEVQALQAAVYAAEQAAAPLTARVAYHENQIADLRACPTPDARTLATLAEAMVGGHIEPCPAKTKEGGSRDDSN